MSASLPAINTKDRSLKMDVRASLRLLHSRRRRFQATTRCAVISMCATVALCLIAAVDYRWPLQRNARAILLSLILLPAFSLLTHAVWLLVRSLSLVDAAREIERAAGINHNAVVTMAESLEGASAEESRLYMLVRLESQARADLSEIDEIAVAAGDAPIRALSGSQVEVILTTGGATSGATLSFNGSQNSMRSLGAGQFSGTFIASESGAFEASVNAYEKLAPASVVRAVEVYNDAAPEARLTEPQNDELLRSLPDAPVIVRWTASDDLGLASVALKYIKSRGIGDAAKFTNGEVGIGSIERQSAHEWRGTSALSLQHLDMQPGDTLVFWIEARDRNPSANNTGRSARLAIALATPEPARLGLSVLMPNR